MNHANHGWFDVFFTMCLLTFDVCYQKLLQLLKLRLAVQCRAYDIRHCTVQIYSSFLSSCLGHSQGPDLAARFHSPLILYIKLILMGESTLLPGPNLFPQSLAEFLNKNKGA